MILHQDKKVFEQAVRYTAEKLNILPIYIEKDYWVTYALKILFTHPTTIALRNKIRHLYDIHQMLKNKELTQFFYSDDFEMMLNKVANDDVDSFKNNNRWLQYHPKEAIIFNDSEIWELLNATYLNDFSKLIYGDLPAAKDIQQTLAQVRDRVDNVKWTLSLPQNL